MSRRPLIVLADDLTGAAEVAALAHEAGLRATVVTQVPRTAAGTDVLVLDTDTRLARPAAAARRVRASMTRLNRLPHDGFFKKTDSVLRGPVLSELKACLDVLKLRRALLVAGNPSLGRVIRDGRCYVGGRPIDRTAFARDPHHPAWTADVRELLVRGWSRGTPAPEGKIGPRAGQLQLRTPVTCVLPGGPLPRNGVIVGEHRSGGDTARWARMLDRGTLPAGGADFFRAWLRTRVAGRQRRPGIAPAVGPALLLHGTTAAPATTGMVPFKGLRAPPVVRVAAALRHRGAAAVAATPLTLNDPLAPAVIARGFAGLVRGLRDAGAFRHLLIAGGATAATVLRALGWTRLEVIRVWGPGVVSLQPVAAPDCTVTLKPGSYPWPAGIRRVLPRVLS